MSFKNDLTAWKALLLTARSGKVSQTAIVMNMTSSKVSRLLSGLEGELGYGLFDKTRRPLQPTERCRELLSALEPLLRDFQDIQAPTFGLDRKTRIRVAAPIEAACDFYTFDFMHYSEMNPNVVFEILPEALAQDVRERRTDVAMLNHIPNDISELKVRQIAVTTTFPMATPAYLRRYGVPKTLADLRNHRGLLLKTKTFPVTRFLLKGNTTSSMLQWGSVFYSHDQMMIKKLLLNDWGISVDLYGGHVLRELEAGEIVPLFPGWTRPAWNMCIVTRQDTEMYDKEIGRFADWWYTVQSANDQGRMIRSHAACEASLKANKSLPGLC